MIWKSDGKVNALLLNESTVVDLGQPNACPDCKVTIENLTAAALNIQPAALAAAAVQRDPNINCDFFMANVVTDPITRGLHEASEGLASTATPKT